MLFMSWLRWWYGLGWRDQVGLVRERLLRSADFFSIGLNVRSLFQPFKQIDAASIRRGSLDAIIRSRLDALFSRVFGAVIRSGLILAGLFALLLESVFGTLRLAAWPVLPILPILCVVFAVVGWVPWR